MLYKFKSAATGDLIMLEPNGRRVLQIIGKEPGPKGIITVDQIPAAIAALEKAIAEDEAQRAAAKAAAADADQAQEGSGDTVPLRQRAVPFIDLIRRAMSEKADVVWGV